MYLRKIYKIFVHKQKIQIHVHEKSFKLEINDFVRKILLMLM